MDNIHINIYHQQLYIYIHIYNLLRLLMKNINEPTSSYEDIAKIIFLAYVDTLKHLPGKN